MREMRERWERWKMRRADARGEGGAAEGGGDAGEEHREGHAVEVKLCLGRGKKWCRAQKEKTKKKKNGKKEGKVSKRSGQ